MPVSLELVSPERLLLSRDVDMVVMPGYEGDIAAMPEHAPMILLLRGGVVALHQGGQVTDRYFVAGGFAEMTPDRCTILADAAVKLEALSRADGEARLRDAEAAWESVDTLDIDAREAVLDQLQSARAQIQFATV